DGDPGEDQQEDEDADQQRQRHDVVGVLAVVLVVRAGLGPLVDGGDRGGIVVLLLVLTWITVAVTWIDLDAMFNVPNLNVVVALGVALIKAAFVGFYFMHLRWDAPFNGLILVASLAFVVLFLSWTILDGQEVDEFIETPRAARSIQSN
ncbi:MAG: cytochrome C oxidase subunit IV family protein, partial [Planctomycetota bacterium]